MRQWQARGVAADWLDAAAMAQVTGARGFLGGWRDPRAGRVHPLKLARGLAQAAEAAGVRVFARTAVTGLMRSGAGWQARLPGGAQITADQVILASNVYTPAALEPRLARATVPANSFQVATAPLSAAQLARILPGGEVVSETRRVGTYFRIGPQNRLMLGGRGGFADPQSADAFARIEAEIAALFGTDLEITHRWFGRVGMTPDHRIRLCALGAGASGGDRFQWSRRRAVGFAWQSHGGASGAGHATSHSSKPGHSHAAAACAAPDLRQPRHSLLPSARRAGPVTRPSSQLLQESASETDPAKGLWTDALASFTSC
ncbi:NAD(P)/FAD-dependent oxidoreductase [Sulfitobacter porphyrae]|uniref:NAD(P)/FAD-dependent oxidoreductase n=1 Tax=Sulfitobacter porphyrae TaxID=1246864 RepID=A0ABW2B7N4_9RHOB